MNKKWKEKGCGPPLGWALDIWNELAHGSLHKHTSDYIIKLDTFLFSI